MEPDVVRLYSSSPPPLEDGAEEEDDEFGDFGTFSGVPSSTSLSEFETQTTFNQNQALTATSPPELLGRGVGFGSNGTCGSGNEPSRSNGVGPRSHPDLDRTEPRKAVSCSLDPPVRGPSGGEPTERNGGDAELLTNGFVTFDLQGSPSSQSSVHCPFKGLSSEDTGSSPAPSPSPEDQFADFSAFSSAEGRLAPQEGPDPPEASQLPPETTVHQGTDDTVRDRDRTGAEAPGGPGTTDSLQRDIAFTEDPSQTESTEDPLVLVDRSKETLEDGDTELPSDAVQSEKSSETETETSFGRPLSTEALEDYGDTSLTGSVPSPPPQGDAASPAEDDEDFGDFGDTGSFGAQDLAGFGDLEVQQDQKTLQGSSPEQEDDFGDFSSLGGDRGAQGGRFPASDSFGTFSSTAGEQQDSGWSAFGDQQETQDESWAEFTEPSIAPPAEREEQEEEWHEGPAVREQVDRTAEHTVLCSNRLEKLFLCSFPQNSVQNQLEDQVVSLRVLLDPTEDRERPGAQEEEQGSLCSLSVYSTMWSRLQDVHEAVGLRYQWGGSHCNKALLCCLGIDTRNILFTGQKNKPVIVPMYAAGLGMLEPTKEPVKVVSAAEMIASIAQTPAAADSSSCPSDSVQQEALPPVQFDWSSSGLTNPLDGVDPELFELTTAKLDSGGSGSRVADAFARLMSTMEKTSTSTRKPRKDENLSEEAAKVIAALPDLSFMQAKVLMFPATLTPLSSQAAAD